MTPPVLADYYRAVADESPIPIVIYNLPPATGIDLPAALLVELSQHPNIIGVKDTGGDMPRWGRRCARRSRRSRCWPDPPASSTRPRRWA